MLSARPDAVGRGVLSEAELVEAETKDVGEALQTSIFSTMIVGILALHGDFAEHSAILRKMKIVSREVRTVHDLNTVDRLIIPGGESTVMALLLSHTAISTSAALIREAESRGFPLHPEENLKEAIRTRNLTGTLPILGTCAGAILLAKEVTGRNAPEPLGLIDITIERNGYGTQLQSFSAEVEMKNGGSVHASFIRAPKITRVGKGVEVLARHEGIPVLVQHGAVMASTFHTEVVNETLLHQIFFDQNITHHFPL
jgi:pyridoxal 5'-phosphate synthase pdxT subunit